MKNIDIITNFTKLIDPSPEIATIFNQWINDPLLIPLIRPSRNKEKNLKHVF